MAAFRLLVVLFGVATFGAGGPAAAQLQPQLPPSLQDERKPIQDMSPSEMLRLFLPKAPAETDAAATAPFDKEQTRRIFDRYRFGLHAREERRTYRAIADLITLILTIKKIGLSQEDTEAIAREMARISVEAHRAPASDLPPIGPPPGPPAQPIPEADVETLLATRNVPLTLPDGRTRVTFIETFGAGVVIRIGDRARRLEPGEGIDVGGGCLLFFEETNRPATIAEFTHRCIE